MTRVLTLGLIFVSQPVQTASAISPHPPRSNPAQPATPPAANPASNVAVFRQAGQAQPVATISAAATSVQQQLGVFDQLWNAVNDNYVYTDFNGYDWAAAKPRVEAQIRAGLSDEAFYALMREQIDNLNDNHSAYLSPEEARDEELEYAGNQEYVGIGIYVGVNVTRRYLYVFSVYPNSPAEEAGLQPHDNILEIDGEPSVNADGESQDQLMRGPEGSTVTLLVRTPGQEPRTVEIPRQAVVARERIIYRILPSDVLTGNKTASNANAKIGYMLVPTFFEANIGRRMRDALRALMKTAGGKLDGLIVDMRINGGGSYPQLSTALSFFTRGTMGSLVNRAGTNQQITIRPQSIGNSQTVPLVVLIGPSTESYAEVYSGALQANGRAKLIGKPSAGNIETLLRHDFDDGSIAWIAEESFQLPDGRSWEGIGLKPDIAVNAAWDEITTADDPVIAAAAKSLQADAP